MSRKSLFRSDSLGNPLWLKRVLFLILGSIVHWRFKILNNTTIKGGKQLRALPVRNVLFVSNHQTYFADVSLMLLAFFSARNGFTKKLGNLLVLFNPKLRIYFIAAAETMQKGLFTKLLTKAGGILVKRTWRAGGEDIQRNVDLSDQEKVSRALKDGWVITFPQGTTKPYVEGRKGTAYIIKENRPIVVPVVIDGFRRAFDKKGMFIKKKGVKISMTFKPALNIDYNASAEDILHQIMFAIEQSPEFYPSNDERLQSQ